ncbi:MAG: gluconate 2-dehydrogenase subunit 3 family protein [Stappiaceae bacterium]
METNATTHWNEDERSLLDGILDQLVPANADNNVPAAGTLGVADFISQKVTEDQELEDLFKQGLLHAKTLVDEVGGSIAALSPDKKKSVVQRLEMSQPAFFQALLRATYMGYYSRPDIRPLFGLSADPTQPGGYEVPPDDPHLIMSLIKPVKQRGRCYRHASLPNESQT